MLETMIAKVQGIALDSHEAKPAPSRLEPQNPTFITSDSEDDDPPISPMTPPTMQPRRIHNAGILQNVKRDPNSIEQLIPLSPTPAAALLGVRLPAESVATGPAAVGASPREGCCLKFAPLPEPPEKPAGRRLSVSMGVANRAQLLKGQTLTEPVADEVVEEESDGAKEELWYEGGLSDDSSGGGRVRNLTQSNDATSTKNLRKAFRRVSSKSRSPSTTSASTSTSPSPNASRPGTPRRQTSETVSSAALSPSTPLLDSDRGRQMSSATSQEGAAQIAIGSSADAAAEEEEEEEEEEVDEGQDEDDDDNMDDDAEAELARSRTTTRAGGLEKVHRTD